MKDFTPKVRKTQGREGFTSEQIQEILATFDDPAIVFMNREQTKTLAHIGALTGLRLACAVNLQWEDVDFENNLITVTPIKTQRIAREVHIPLFPELRAIIEPHKKKKGYIMPDVQERYTRNPDGVVRDFQKVLEHLKYEINHEKPKKGAHRQRSAVAYGFHSLRHSFASIAAAKGVPISLLADILGDNITTLQKYYIHVADSQRAQLVEAFKPLESKKEATKALTTGAKTLQDRVYDLIIFVKDSSTISEQDKKRMVEILGIREAKK